MAKVSRFKACSAEELRAFVAAYPRTLDDITFMYEPPLLTYNDFSIAPKWPESVVAMAKLIDKDTFEDCKILKDEDGAA